MCVVVVVVVVTYFDVRFDFEFLEITVIFCHNTVPYGLVSSRKFCAIPELYQHESPDNPSSFASSKAQHVDKTTLWVHRFDLRRQLSRFKLLDNKAHSFRSINNTPDIIIVSVSM